MPRRGSATISTSLPPQYRQLDISGNAWLPQTLQREAFNNGTAAGQSKRHSSIALLRAAVTFASPGLNKSFDQTVESEYDTADPVAGQRNEYGADHDAS
jgi:hypothetical protein